MCKDSHGGVVLRRREKGAEIPLFEGVILREGRA